MINSIQFLSRKDFNNLTPSPKSVVISILDHYEERVHGSPNLKGFKDSLSLRFMDTWESEGVQWPDDPSSQEHFAFSRCLLERVPTLEHARSIVQFVNKHMKAKHSVDLVVHCQAGISRSAATALWSRHFTLAPIKYHKNQDFSGANPRLIRLLDKAALEL